MKNMKVLKWMCFETKRRGFDSCGLRGLGLEFFFKKKK